MIIDLVCSDPEHPVIGKLRDWIKHASATHDVVLHHNLAHLRGGDVLFLISCMEIVRPRTREQYGNVLVLHASDLPDGRGWSPHVWDILAGKDEITVCLLDAADPVDSGDIWVKRSVSVPRGAVFEEISEILFSLEVELMDEGIRLIAAGAKPVPQFGECRTWHRRRIPNDSEIDPEATIAGQFDAIRVSDPLRYPAYFRYLGSVYTITITKVENNANDID